MTAQNLNDAAIMLNYVHKCDFYSSTVSLRHVGYLRRQGGDAVRHQDGTFTAGPSRHQDVTFHKHFPRTLEFLHPFGYIFQCRGQGGLEELNK